MTQNLVSIRVWGDYACYTRPEMKVERVSYPIMTPSAARGILEAIFWKPEMYYLIDSIKVIDRGCWTSIRRNEVTKRISLTQARSAMKGEGNISTIKAGGGADDATQRNMLVLKDVDYIITAEIAISDIGREAGHLLPKYKEEFERRARSGKCFHRPGLGMREFAADFDWVDDPGKFLPCHQWNEELGLMLYDVFSHRQRVAGFKFLNETENASTGPNAKKKKGVTETKGLLVKPSAAFFFASVKDSIMDCSPHRIRMIEPTGGEN